MSPESVQARLQRLQAELERARSARYSAEGRLEQLRQAEAKLLQEMKAEGVSPETISGEIARLQREIGQYLERAEKLLSGELSPDAVPMPEPDAAAVNPTAQAGPASRDRVEALSLFDVPDPDSDAVFNPPDPDPAHWAPDMPSDDTDDFAFGEDVSDEAPF